MKPRLHWFLHQIERKIWRLTILTWLGASFQERAVEAEMLKLIGQRGGTNIDAYTQNLWRDERLAGFSQISNRQFLSNLDDHHAFISNPPALKAVTQADFNNVRVTGECFASAGQRFLKLISGGNRDAGGGQYSAWENCATDLHCDLNRNLELKCIGARCSGCRRCGGRWRSRSITADR